MNWLGKTYRSIADHIGKILSTLGGVLLSVDIGGYGAQINAYAGQYLGAEAVKKISVGIFVLLFLRTLYAGYKLQKTQEALAAAQAGTQLPKSTVDIPMPPVNAVKILIAFTLLAAALSASVAVATEIPPERDIPVVVGHPLTSVVVTQCNLIVAVYMTMPDGRLLRFDKSADIPSERLMSMAYSATRSERVEVSCNSIGAFGYETHGPV